MSYSILELKLRIGSDEDTQYTHMFKYVWTLRTVPDTGAN